MKSGIITTSNIEQKVEEKKFEPAISNKITLLLILIIFFAAFLATDYCASLIAERLEEVLKEIFSLKNRNIGFGRLLIEDLVVDFGLITVVGTAFTKYPHSFFEFNNYRKFKEEYQFWVLIRIFRNIFLTSVVLVLFFGILQGLFWWLPEGVFGAYIEPKYPEYKMDFSIPEPSHWDYIFNSQNKPYVTYAQMFDSYFPWAKKINFSLIFLFFFRANLVIQIFQAIFSKKHLEAWKIFVTSLVFVVVTSLLFIPKVGKKSEVVTSVEIKKISSEVGTKPTPPPKLYIEVFDPATGETTTSEIKN